MPRRAVHIINHSLHGQVCHQCNNPADYIGFGVSIEEGQPTENVTYAFVCKGCVPNTEEVVNNA